MRRCSKTLHSHNQQQITTLWWSCSSGDVLCRACLFTCYHMTGLLFPHISATTHQQCRLFFACHFITFVLALSSTLVNLDGILKKIWNKHSTRLPLVKIWLFWQDKATSLPCKAGSYDRYGCSEENNTVELKIPMFSEMTQWNACSCQNGTDSV